MQYFSKKAGLALVVSGLILSVFMLFVTPNTIANVSAIEANGVGVYRDSNCSEGVSSINWGNLAPGSLAPRPAMVVVFVPKQIDGQAEK